jgi:hypothetical protein
MNSSNNYAPLIVFWAILLGLVIIGMIRSRLHRQNTIKFLLAKRGDIERLIAGGENLFSDPIIGKYLSDRLPKLKEEFLVISSLLEKGGKTAYQQRWQFENLASRLVLLNDAAVALAQTAEESERRSPEMLMALAAKIRELKCLELGFEDTIRLSIAESFCQKARQVFDHKPINWILLAALIEHGNLYSSNIKPQVHAPETEN